MNFNFNKRFFLLFESDRDFAHYLFIYGVLLVAWIPLMTFFQNQVAPTALAGFFLLVLADKLAHKILKVS